jgi:hypothetical protein
MHDHPRWSQISFVAGAGAIATCTFVWFDEVNHVGIFEPVPCYIDHKREGLASTVMTEGLRQIHALGGALAQVMSHRDDSLALILTATLALK